MSQAYNFIVQSGPAHKNKNIGVRFAGRRTWSARETHLGRVAGTVQPALLIITHIMAIKTQNPKKKNGPEIPSSPATNLALLLLFCNRRSQGWWSNSQNHGGFFWVPNSWASLFHSKLLFFTIRWNRKFTETGTKPSFNVMDGVFIRLEVQFLFNLRVVVNFAY